MSTDSMAEKKAKIQKRRARLRAKMNQAEEQFLRIIRKKAAAKQK